MLKVEGSKSVYTALHAVGPSANNSGYTFTVGQDIFADIILLWISRIFKKPRKDHVCEYDFNPLFAKKL